TGEVKKALADRAEAVDSGTATSLARTEPAGGLPAELRRLDVVVIMLHGPYGEDGTIQGLFELADLPYVGAGVLASAVGMDKATTKAVFQAHGLPIVEHLVVTRHEWRAAPERVARRVAETLGFPCFVKPSNLGSSVGISKVADASALPRALDEAARHDRKILVERAVRGREIEVSVLGNNEPVASVPGEITYAGELYDYATKYAEGQAALPAPAPRPRRANDPRRSTSSSRGAAPAVTRVPASPSPPSCASSPSRAPGSARGRASRPAASPSAPSPISRSRRGSSAGTGRGRTC